jgi:ABC-type sugar transport system substrate-binding protein
MTEVWVNWFLNKRYYPKGKLDTKESIMKKKHFVKNVAGLLLGIGLLAMLGACSKSKGAATAEGASTTFRTDTTTIVAAENGKEALPRYKIVFTYADLSSKLGSQFKGSMEYIAAAMNVEFVFVESGYGEEVITALEAATAQGDIDGVVAVQAASPALVTAVNGVPIVTPCAFPASDAVAKEVSAYENFLGIIMDSDYQAGYEASKALYDAGCRNVCLGGLTQGMSKSHDDRVNGFKNFLNEHPDMKLLADDYTRGQFASSVSSFAAAFPEMDGIFVTSGSDAVLQAMQTEGLVGHVKLATIDVSGETGKFFQNGTLAWCAGGQYGSAMLGLAILYNYLADGTHIISDTAVAIDAKYIYMRTYEEFENYIKYVDSGIPVYVGDEIKQMIHYYNPNVNLSYFKTLTGNYSLEDIARRHAGLF